MKLSAVIVFAQVGEIAARVGEIVKQSQRLFLHR